MTEALARGQARYVRAVMRATEAGGEGPMPVLAAYQMNACAQAALAKRLAVPVDAVGVDEEDADLAVAHGADDPIMHVRTKMPIGGMPVYDNDPDDRILVAALPDHDATGSVDLRRWLFLGWLRAGDGKRQEHRVPRA